LSDLRESGKNPRRHMDQGAMKELTESIRAQGVLVPLLVRPVFVRRGEIEVKVYDIVCGSRRFAAAHKAGLVEVPVRVKDLSDEQVLEIAIIDNLQREDVHPLDEAEGYARLMKSGRYDATALAAKVGRSESYIHRRVKLSALIEPAQKAFWADKINAGHAELIARLQPPDQRKVVEFATTRTNCTTAVLEHYIAENVLLRLREAPFDKKDTTLSIHPGGCACVVCHKRTSAAPLLFPEVGKDDRCTDPACWQAKVEAHVKRLLEQGDGEVKRLRLSEEYSYGQVKESGVVSGGKWREIGPKGPRCEHARQGVIVKGSRRGRVLTVCIEPKCKLHGARPTSGYDRTEDRWTKERKEKEALAGAFAERTRRLVMERCSADWAPLGEAVRTMGAAVVHVVGHETCKAACARFGLEPEKNKDHAGRDYYGALRAHLAALGGRQAFATALEMLLMAAMGRWSGEDRAGEFCKICGLDAKKIKAQVVSDRKAAAAAKKVKAAKKGGKGKGKPKAEKACVECGCTEGKACIDERSGTPCSWVPAADLPEGVKGPLCSTCLPVAEAKNRLKKVSLPPRKRGMIKPARAGKPAAA